MYTSVKEAIKKNLSEKSAGNTLIEMLVVVAIVGMLALSTIFIPTGMKNRASLNQAKAYLVSAIEQAQNQAATGVGTGKHGVHIDVGNKKIINFEGDSYPGFGVETSLPENIASITVSGAADVIFNRISASTTLTTPDNTIVVSDSDGNTKTVIISQDGKINY